MPRHFTKTTEDFICHNCDAQVHGDGYTNHCPQCLWSKHVDIYPGDRQAHCDGMMPPIMCEKEGQEYILTHECTMCAHQKRNKVQEGDNFDAVIKIATT